MAEPDILLLFLLPPTLETQVYQWSLRKQVGIQVETATICWDERSSKSTENQQYKLQIQCTRYWAHRRGQAWEAGMREVDREPEKTVLHALISTNFHESSEEDSPTCSLSERSLKWAASGGREKAMKAKTQRLPRGNERECFSLTLRFNEISWKENCLWYCDFQ